MKLTKLSIIALLSLANHTTLLAEAISLPWLQKIMMQHAKQLSKRPITDTNKEKDKDLDIALILDRVQLVMNGVFNIVKDPHNPHTMEQSIGNIFGGVAGIVSHTGLCKTVAIKKAALRKHRTPSKKIVRRTSSLPKK